MIINSEEEIWLITSISVNIGDEKEKLITKLYLSYIYRQNIKGL